jgi:Ca2+-binding RTX toxin-like protein
MLHGRKPHIGHRGPLAILTGALVALALLLIPAAANATIATKAKRTTAGGFATLTITTDPAVEHNLSITWDWSNTEYLIKDYNGGSSLPLDADLSCRLDPANDQMICNQGRPAISFIRITTGQRDDRVDVYAVSGEQSDIATGAGNDSVQGLEGFDEIDAGVGNDSVDGRGGVDHIHGGDGDDTLRGGSSDDLLLGEGGDDTLIGGTGADQINGGDGIDLADYAALLDPVTVTLDGVANDGTGDEQDDVLPDVENVRGGAGNDTLTGNDRANTLSGGDGNDFINSRDSGADEVQCGRDSDRAVVDSLDTVESRCETVEGPPGTVVPPVIAPPTFELLVAGCSGKPKSASAACLQIRCANAQGGCDGNVSLEAATLRTSAVNQRSKKQRSARIKVGSGSFSASESETVTVSVKLSRQGRKLLSRRGSLSVKASADAYDASGQRRTASGTVKLAAKPRRGR